MQNIDKGCLNMKLGKQSDRSRIARWEICVILHGDCLAGMAALIEERSVDAVYVLGDFNAHPGTRIVAVLQTGAKISAGSLTGALKRPKKIFGWNCHVKDSHQVAKITVNVAATKEESVQKRYQTCSGDKSKKNLGD
ncbi:unnamed protein product [Leptidea sinapis]|uniref:Endonuclease/exonuclease/phosphatase domain-containing protein n=1 Tax=Leptidea sinapis TaxID=189913 RepID=A0A5E4PN66_9NEOP|nr:unnamed protein product [Leptidea sinapis]